jgi:hypothetical protein
MCVEQLISLQPPEPATRQHPRHADRFSCAQQRDSTSVRHDPRSRDLTSADTPATRRSGDCPGSVVEPGAAARLLGESIAPNALTHHLWVLRSSAYWQSICVAIIRLSDYLDESGAPIDYQRRRHLDYSALLTDAAWQQICAQANDSRSEPGIAVGARYHLTERLSGTAAMGLLPMNGELDERAYDALVADFRRKMTVQLEERLHAHAQSFLAQRDIAEPVTWHPPLGLLDDLPLPEPT